MAHINATSSDPEHEVPPPHRPEPSTPKTDIFPRKETEVIPGIPGNPADPPQPIDPPEPIAPPQPIDPPGPDPEAPEVPPIPRFAA